MHFILCPVGSAGDVHPYLALGLMMRSRGHRVTFVVNGYFHDLVESHGFEQLEFGTAEQFLEAANNADLWHPRKALGHIFQTYVEPYAPLQIDLIRSAYEPGSVVLTSCLGIGALMTRETDQIPVVTVHLQPSVIWSSINPPKFPGAFGPRWLQRMQYGVAKRYILPILAGRPVNRVRAAYGLPPIDDLMEWWHSPDGVLCLFPSWFCAPAPDWPEVMQSDFPLWDAGSDGELSPEVCDFLEAGDPPVAFTPGSANRFGREFFDEAVAACEQANVRGIMLSKFSDQIPPLPDSCAHFKYVPFEPLLRQCAAVVHHGGVGSTAQGFRAGIPQLIMALAHDQYDNGTRVEKLGAGRWIRSKQFKRRRVAGLLKELLEGPEYAATARRIAERVTTDGPLRSVELLEERFSQTPVAT